MKIEKIKKYLSWVSLASFIGAIVGLVMSSLIVTTISLLIFCLSSNLATITIFYWRIERLAVVSDLLRGGVFDPVLDIPEEIADKIRK